MIRSLRVWHRRLIPVLTVLLIALLAAALWFRSPEPVGEPLPVSLTREVGP